MHAAEAERESPPGDSAVRWSWQRQWVPSLPSGVVRARCWLACGMLSLRCTTEVAASPCRLGYPLSFRTACSHTSSSACPSLRPLHHLCPCFRGSFEKCCPSCPLQVPSLSLQVTSLCPHCPLTVPSLSLTVPSRCPHCPLTVPHGPLTILHCPSLPLQVPSLCPAPAPE